MASQPDNPWRRIVFAGDLEPCYMCGEPWCGKCNNHYADCDCLGPTQDGVEYLSYDGVLMGRIAPGGNDGQD